MKLFYGKNTDFAVNQAFNKSFELLILFVNCEDFIKNN